MKSSSLTAASTKNFDHHKLLALKLAKLPWLDRAWLLAKLPKPQRNKLKHAIKFARALGPDVLEQLIEHAGAPALTVNNEPNSKPLTLQSVRVQHQLDAIAQGKVDVSPKVQQWLQDGGML